MHFPHNELNAEKSPVWQDNALFASKAKINVFLNFFEHRVPTEWQRPGSSPTPQKGPRVNFFFKNH